MWQALARREMHRGLWSEEQKEIDHLEDLSVDGIIIIMCFKEIVYCPFLSFESKYFFQHPFHKSLSL
jgi:hypothetical protein